MFHVAECWWVWVHVFAANINLNILKFIKTTQCGHYLLKSHRISGTSVSLDTRLHIHIYWEITKGKSVLGWLNQYYWIQCHANPNYKRVGGNNSNTPPSAGILLALTLCRITNVWWWFIQPNNLIKSFTAGLNSVEFSTFTETFSTIPRGR